MEMPPALVVATKFPVCIMDKLPEELVAMILPWIVRMCPAEKNKVATHRLVCKAFDRILRPFVCKTLVLEFGKFQRNGGSDISALDDVGQFCQAVYLDMMVVRDEEEVTRLAEVFQGITNKLPQMGTMIEALRQNCLNENTFDETDFNKVVDRTFELAPKLDRLKINLPFHVLGRTGSTATLLLANVLASVAKRPEESKPLEYLVIDHLCDSTIIDLCHNPRDVRNAVTVLTDLEHLILSIKRQETGIARQLAFAQHLWYLIRKATKLGSLCIIGWNGKRDVNVRKHRPSVDMEEWRIRALPYFGDPIRKVQHLRCLELKRIDVDPAVLIDVIGNMSTALKELYLNEVYLKVHGARQTSRTPLWIGYPDEHIPDDYIWVARSLRNMKDLHLEILRVSGLGYDDYKPDPTSLKPNYDLIDSSSVHMSSSEIVHTSFDKRFVDAVMSPFGTASEATITPIADSQLVQSPYLNGSQTVRSPTNENEEWTEKSSYDVEVFQQYHYNSTSYFKKCIDGHFINHNDRALEELQRIITVADHGMALIAEEMDRTRYEPWTN